jgi:RNA polymerase sigma-70 factor (ECF subfamily)
MARQDDRRFEEIVLPHLDAAYTLARYLVRDEHDAQDIVQDASLRALRHFEGFRDGDARAWLLTIVRNACYSWHRSHRVERASVSLTDDLSKDLASSRSADALAIESSERERVHAAVATLAPELREVIVLRELQDLSYREISEIIGIPMGTVMSRLSRARDRLAVALGGGAREAS